MTESIRHKAQGTGHRSSVVKREALGVRRKLLLTSYALRLTTLVTGLFLLLAASCLLPALYASGISGQKILQKVDQVGLSKDKTAKITMILIDRRGKELKRTMESEQVGTEKSLMKFLSPADIKGTSFLSLKGGDKMYLYLPALKKVRRIAGHVKNTNFMGSDFTYDDLAGGQLSPKWEAKLLKQTTSHYVLELTPKKGTEVAYRKLIMTVEAKHFIPVKIEFYVEKKRGKEKTIELRKILTNSKISLVKKRWIPLQIEMENLKKKHKTIMKIDEVKFDTGLPARVFDKRYLSR